jgi:iron complex transport system ATP-binding protein
MSSVGMPRVVLDAAGARDREAADAAPVRRRVQPSPAPALAAEALRVTLPGGVEALRGVSLEVRPGEVVAVLGPNGAGKSTLARALAGLIAPAAGHARLGGDEAHRLPRREAARRVAYLPQETPADLPYTAAEVALMGRAPHLGRFGLDGPEDRAAAAAALAAVRAEGLADRPLGALSGGERRRVLLARLLAQDAPAWILDEPTAHLDLAHQVLILDLARRRARAGHAVLAVLHELWAAETCDRLVLLRAGEVVAAGTPRELLAPDLLEATFGVRFTTATNPLTGGSVLVPVIAR